MVEFFPERPRRNKNKAVSGKKNWILAMTLTGNLIESLMATVERVEQSSGWRRAQADEPLFAENFAGEPLLAEPWLASIQENADYDANFIGVA